MTSPGKGGQEDTMSDTTTDQGSQTNAGTASSATETKADPPVAGGGGDAVPPGAPLLELRGRHVREVEFQRLTDHYRTIEWHAVEVA